MFRRLGEGRECEWGLEGGDGGGGGVSGVDEEGRVG